VGLPASSKAASPHECLESSNSVAILSTTAAAWHCLQVSAASLPSAPGAPAGPSFVQLVKTNPAAAMKRPAARINLVTFFISAWFWLINSFCWVNVNFLLMNYFIVNFETNISKLKKQQPMPVMRYVYLYIEICYFITDKDQPIVDICQWGKPEL
jgi:hypothetical protein